MNIFCLRHRAMGCAEVGRILQNYLDGDLDDRRSARLRAHLDDCRRCGMEVDTYTQIKTCLARRSAALPADAVARLRAFGQHLAVPAPPEAS